MSDDTKDKKLSVLKGRFWDLWFQKILRNIASMKYQFLAILIIIVVKGMFTGKWVTEDDELKWVAVIPPVIGCSLLGGGFVTLAASRIIANTKLVEKNGNSEMDTDS